MLCGGVATPSIVPMTKSFTGASMTMPHRLARQSNGEALAGEAVAEEAVAGAGLDSMARANAKTVNRRPPRCWRPIR